MGNNNNNNNTFDQQQGKNRKYFYRSIVFVAANSFILNKDELVFPLRPIIYIVYIYRIASRVCVYVYMNSETIIIELLLSLLCCNQVP